jgi:eukaryotic-like serine/threonine-protein kinase
MFIPSGTQVGRYEIRSQLGAGGMGEVYLARDTQLDRMAALKILSVEVASDQQRLIRFLQEARAASALSHPNVAHIYEIGEADNVRFIAMEFVEGEGLDKRISGRPLGVGEILDFGVQIADALDQAHAKGITHRDIKSPNIMITPRGQVKVLDFGLAKLAPPVGLTDRTSDSEVATRLKTSPGMIMGTVNYMSPEQAMGREVDHRSDIFSFGVVLYEMATGRLPFAGDTVMETIDRITHSEPQAIARLNYDVPSDLEIIVKKALRKNREERYQTIHDVLVDLKNLRRELDLAAGQERSIPPKSAEIQTSTFVRPARPAALVSGPSEPSLFSAAHPTSSAEYIISEVKWHKKGTLAAAAIALLVLAVVSVGLYKFLSKTPPTMKLSSTGASNMQITRLTVNGKATSATISPDGKLVAYVSKEGEQQSLWIKQIATNSNVLIVPPANVDYGGAKFSPDGNYIYYLATDPNDPASILYQVPSLGGPPRKILARVDSTITFSPDANRIAFIRNDVAASKEDQLIVANADGTGGERKLATRKGDTWFTAQGCGWSPDGKTIACPGGSNSGGRHLTVITVDAETGQQNELARQRFQGRMAEVAWLTDGSGVVVSAAEPKGSSQLWLISYPSGEGHKITNELNGYSGVSLTADSKMLVTVCRDPITNIWNAPHGDAAQAKQLTSGKAEGNGGLAWTPDGRIVYTSLDSGNAQIWIMKDDGSSQKQITPGPENAINPAVSPDGRYIVFDSGRGGLPSLWRVDLDGGNPKQLTRQDDHRPHISPDGQWIIFESWHSERGALWKVSIDGGQPVQLTDKSTSSGDISPDGKLIACFYKDEQPSAQWRIMILSFDGGSPMKTFDTPSAAEHFARDAGIAWTPDGRGIVYIDSLGGTANLWSQSLGGGPPKKLTDFKENGVSQYAWSRDGKQLALTRATTTNDVVLIRDFK